VSSSYRRHSSSRCAGERMASEPLSRWCRPLIRAQVASPVILFQGLRAILPLGRRAREMVHASVAISLARRSDGARTMISPL
jgi:hypothetical protein